MKKKVSLIVLVLIILVVASFFVWQLWSKNTATHHWKTYKNQTLGFTFQYPSDWKINLNPEFNKTVTLEKIDLTQEKVLWSMGIKDEYIYPNYTIRFQREIEKYFKEAVADKSYNIQKIKIGNLKAYQFQEASAPSSGSAIITLTKKNSHYISATYTAYAHEETHFKFEHTYNQILSTFKFID